MHYPGSFFRCFPVAWGTQKSLIHYFPAFSGRSHVVFSITLESTSTFEDGTNVSRRGELKIVDLAGNEKAGRASEGVENAKLVLEEGKAINKSLFLLSYV